MKLTALSALVAVLMSSPCQSQTDAQRAHFLFQQSVEAMGGAEAIAKVTNLSVRGTGQGIDGRPFIVEVQSILPDRTFFRQTFHNLVNEVTLVGDVTWRRQPETGALTLLKEPHHAKLLRQREIHLMLENLVDRFTTYTVVGTEIRAGVPCTLVEMQDQWAQMGSVCFDQKTHLPMELNFRRPPAAGGEHVTITLEEWTKVGAVLFPLALSVTEGQQKFSFRYDSIQIGVVKPDLFQIPPEIQKQLADATAE